MAVLRSTLSTFLSVLLVTGCGGEPSAGTTSVGSGSTTAGGGGSGGTSTGGMSTGGTSTSTGGTSTGGTSTGGTSTGGTSTSAGGSFVPDPVPEIDPEPAAPCQKAVDTPDYFQFLDNLCKEKKWPSSQDRDRACPSADPSPVIQLAGGQMVTYHPSSDPVEVDDTALNGIVPDGMNVTVILIRRVGGVPHYRYLSNGTHDVAYQPWSSTKFLAAANAASNLRIQSSYKVGLTGQVDGVPLGDYVTSVCNYDDNPFSSNSLAAYFHNVGGRKRADDLVHALWLGRPASETFGGNYGEAAAKVGYTFQEDSGDSVTITPDPSSGFANNLASFTTAEALRRLALHREEPDQRLPGIQWKDIQVLLYGAAGSAKYGPWGGMSADTSIYLQSAHDIAYLEKRSHGQWSIFSKLGLGTQGQFVNVGYACFPVLDDQDQPVPGWGREFVFSAQLASGGATWKERDRLLAKAYRAVVTRIVDGRL